MERAEESGRDDHLGPYERSRLNEDTFADTSEAEPGQMCCDRGAVVQNGSGRNTRDEDYVERICRVDTSCKHVPVISVSMGKN